MLTPAAAVVGMAAPTLPNSDGTAALEAAAAVAVAVGVVALAVDGGAAGAGLPMPAVPPPS